MSFANIALRKKDRLENLINEGDLNAVLKLADMLLNGMGGYIKTDYKRAILLIRSVLKTQIRGKAISMLGDIEYQSEKFRNAIKYYKLAWENGFDEAEIKYKMTSEIYELRKKSQQRALKIAKDIASPFFESECVYNDMMVKANSGDLESILTLIDDNKTVRKAKIRLYLMAATKGHVLSQFELGRRYLYGHDVEKNTYLGHTWMNIAIINAEPDLKKKLIEKRDDYIFSKEFDEFEGARIQAYYQICKEKIQGNVIPQTLGYNHYTDNRNITGWGDGPYLPLKPTREDVKQEWLKNRKKRMDLLINREENHSQEYYENRLSMRIKELFPRALSMEKEERQELERQIEDRYHEELLNLRKAKEKSATLKEEIYRDIGRDLPISGGYGMSINDAIIIEATPNLGHIDIEKFVLDYILNKYCNSYEIIFKSHMIDETRDYDVHTFLYCEVKDLYRERLGWEKIYFDITEGWKAEREFIVKLLSEKIPK